MGVFDPNYKRLSILIICFLFLTCMYTAEAILINHTYEYEDSFTGENQNLEDDYLDEQNESSIREQTENQGGNLLDIIGFLTFVRPDILPSFMIAILAPITTIFLIVLIYLVIDIIYDIVKALPFT